MDIEPGIFAVLNQAGAIVGTGFLVSGQFGVTCSHVIVAADALDGDTVQVRFSEQTEKINALVIPEFWRAVDKGDIAILKLDSVPAGVNPLRLAPAANCRPGSAFRSFGYAIAADVQGIHANGKIDGYLPQHNLLQLQSPQANHGISGAPVLDEKRAVLLGMITKGHTELGRNELTTFATPSEILWQVCPQLKPPTPILPRRNPIVEGINLLPYDYDQRIQNFLTEYLGTDSHPVPFGGRDNALHMLNAWLAETTPYLLLAAPAGRGKSALLVRWLDSLSMREDLALAFVPVSIRFGTNMERVFYAALAARLAFLHGDDIPASPETSTAVYRGLVSDYLSKPLANGQTLLVVLDGLDEAADWQAGADFMPGELPAGVRVVVSARFLAGDADSTLWLRRLNWERNGLASAPSLIPLDQDGVRDVLFKMGCPLDELSRKVNIVAELYRLSEGDPLLVGLYVRDLWTKGEKVSRLKPEDLAGIQPGYKGYFDRWWSDQKRLWGKKKLWLQKYIYTVQNLLAGALGPLFISDVQALSPKLTSMHIADALDILQRFIIGDNQTQGFTFSHPKLGQYFWEALSPTEQMQLERRFLAWCGQAFQEFIDGKRDPKKKGEVPAYVVRNYGAHLARANQPIEKWLPLIHHQQWAQAWFTVEGAYGGYLQDVHRVWEYCRLLDRRVTETDGKSHYLGQQIQCALIESSLHSLAKSIPTNLIWPLVRDEIWTLSQTWVFIHQIPDGFQQTQAFLTLLPHLVGQQLIDALTTARSIQNELYRAQVLSHLANYLPNVSEEALSVAKAIREEKWRSWVLSYMARQLPKEALGQVLEATRAIQFGEYRAGVLSTLAKRMPEVAREALIATQTISHELERAQALSTLVECLPEIAEEALASARRINYEGERVRILGILMEYLPEIAEEALETSLAIQDNWERTCALRGLTAHLPENKLLQAMESVLAIQDEQDRSYALSNLVERLPKDKLDHVLGVLQGIDDENNRAIVLSALAKRLPNMAGDVLTTVRLVKDDKKRAVALSTLAQDLPELTEESLVAARTIHDKKEQVEILNALEQHFPEIAGKALVIARNIMGEIDRAGAFSKIAQRLPEVAGEALAAALAIRSETWRDMALYNLTQVLSEVAGEALTAAMAIRDETLRNRVVNDLAESLPEKELDQVLVAAVAIKDEEYRARVLTTLVGRLSESNLEHILNAVGSIESEYFRAYVLSALTERQPEVTMEALTAVRAIQGKTKRAWALIDLAKRIPEVVEEALEAARAIEDKENRAWMLGALAGLLPEVTIEALDVTRAIEDKGKRAEMLCVLAEKLPEIAKEALNVIRVIEDKGKRAEMLCVLMEFLPEIAEEALEASLTIQNEWKRDSVLNDLAARLLEISESLKAARAIGDERMRANALSGLAQRLPEIVGETLEAAGALYDAGYTDDRTNVLSALIQPLLQVPNGVSYDNMEKYLLILASNARSYQFADLATLMPVLIHLGTEDTPREIYEAVRDVTTWWP